MVTSSDTSHEAIALRRIDRAVHELRGGYPVALTDSNGRIWLIASAEGLSAARYHELALPPYEKAALVLTDIRMRRLGLPTTPDHRAYGLPLAPLMSDAPDAAQLPRVARLIDPLDGKADISGLAEQLRPAQAVEAAALELARLSALLPAVVAVPLEAEQPHQWTSERHILTLQAGDIERFRQALSATLTQVGEAHVPLKLAENTRVLAFRPRYGGVEHLAVCIGKPEQAEAPLVRLHSSCVTGDILGSLRCDCGDQLHEAIARVAQEGHGVVLYLSQEGRGIGIVNKLRAYRLQDAGLDTLDANEEMGFAADERNFDIAAHILEALGIRKVRLLSNNPDKVAQLERNHITVVERVSLSLPANEHNRHYLHTKEKRCGHMF